MTITTNRCKLLGELVAIATAPMILTLLFFALRETLTDFGAIYLIALGAVANSSPRLLNACLNGCDP